MAKWMTFVFHYWYYASFSLPSGIKTSECSVSLFSLHNIPTPLGLCLLNQDTILSSKCLSEVASFSISRQLPESLQFTLSVDHFNTVLTFCCSFPLPSPPYMPSPREAPITVHYTVPNTYSVHLHSALALIWLQPTLTWILHFTCHSGHLNTCTFLFTLCCLLLFLLLTILMSPHYVCLSKPSLLFLHQPKIFPGYILAHSFLTLIHLTNNSITCFLRLSPMLLSCHMVVSYYTKYLINSLRVWNLS